MAARPEGTREGAPRLARTADLAAATLRRAGLGPLRRAIVADTAALHVLRADVTLTLAVTLPRTTSITQGLLEVNRLWAAAQHELIVARDELVDTPAPADARRES
jgi:hypothetical protein